MGAVRLENQRRIIDKGIGSAVYLDRERIHLPSLIASDEVLLDVEPTAIGFGHPGLLALTNARLLHVWHLVRWFRVRSFAYETLSVSSYKNRSETTHGFSSGQKRKG